MKDKAQEPDTSANGADIKQDKEVQSVGKEADELREEIMQLTAHFENLRRDLLRDMSAAERRGIASAVRALAPALDSLLLAEKNSDGETREGIKKTYDQFVQALGRLGVTRIDCGGSYDPKFHEAVERIPGEQYQIIEEVSGGWMWKKEEQVIVPAKVKVGDGRKNQGA